ncbi:MAG: PilZ domain-containing protein [Candidatus Omnitrophica bacterium]|nr:PilZ domain-containing protein [Candidatus Omnitrophota bacterium]
MSDDRSYSEKRKYPRINKHFILSYFDLNDPLVRHDASQLKNISIGGMCLITSKVYPQGTRLGIELRTPFLSEFIHLKGTVLESKEKIKGIIYETRLQFDDIPEKTLVILKKMVEHFEHEKSK